MMADVAIQNDSTAARGKSGEAVGASGLVVLLAGMAAAWLAAGSTGLLGDSLERGLTILALGTTVVAAWPGRCGSAGNWALLAVGAILALGFLAASAPAVHILAVATFLGSVAAVERGLTGRVALLAALSALALGIFRFACDAIPTVWIAADGLGWIFGRAAGWLVGSRLEVGATYGGVDFLVSMSALFAGWLASTAPPRRSRAIWAAGAILVGYFVYLIALAQSEKLLAMLPDLVVPPESDINRVGIWTWGNGLRTLIPWNVPLLAAIVQGAIAAAMVRSATWLPVVELDARALAKQKEREAKEDVPGSVLAADMLFNFGPPVLAVAAVLLGTLVSSQPDLKGKTIVAYEAGRLDWDKPEYDSTKSGTFGMLPVFVESLGAKFVKSPRLSDSDLKDADVLLLLHPDKPWLDEQQERVWDFVRRGGSLLVVGDPAVREGDSASTFNEVLQGDEIPKTGLRIREDTAIPRTRFWERAYQALTHPTTAGIDTGRSGFGFELGSSIRVRWPARPVVVGRWGWSEPGSDAAATGVAEYDAGEQLGDLVLAAEQPIGKGRVFVLGGVAPLHNEGLASSYSFVGRALCYLAQKTSSPQAMWRQVLGMLAIAGLLALVVIGPAAKPRPVVAPRGATTGRGFVFGPAARQVTATSAIMAVAIVCCTAKADWSGRVLPDGRSRGVGGINNVAYVDASHLEAYSSDPDTNHGTAELLRALMRQGYLPLFASDLSRERIERAGIVISIGPAREFSEADRATIKDYVGRGGTFIMAVGAQETRPSAALLADFGFTVPPTPVPPGAETVEPVPIGCGITGVTTGGKPVGPFYAAWGVETDDKSDDAATVIWTGKPCEATLVASRPDGGAFVVIGDTHVASNENILFDEKDARRFWRWLLSHVVAGQTPWELPAEKGDGSSGGADDAGDEGG